MLERIQATLVDAEEREVREESVKLWLKELKRVAFAAEDLLGEYQYEFARAEVEGRDGKDAEVQIPDDILERIREIKNQFDEIAKDWEALHLLVKILLFLAFCFVLLLLTSVVFCISFFFCLNATWT